METLAFYNEGCLQLLRPTVPGLSLVSAAAPPPDICNNSSHTHSITISREDLIASVVEIHAGILSLEEDLRPSGPVNELFSRLVSLCLHRCEIDFGNPEHVNAEVAEIRGSLIRLCGKAEGLLEEHYARILGDLPEPHNSFHLFPYYSNYLKLAMLEHHLLLGAAAAFSSISMSAPEPMEKVAFIGSGPMPLTSIVLAANHLRNAVFDNYDLDPQANELASKLVSRDPDLSARMRFHTCDILQVGQEMASYDVVFLAALVGLDQELKRKILKHLSDNMRHGASLVVRSANSARAFLYPIVDLSLLQDAGFQVLSVFHPTDEVVNSVIVAKLTNKTLPLPLPIPAPALPSSSSH